MTVYRPRRNPLLMTVMGANPGSGPVDPDAARELELYVENDGDLYRQQYVPIIKNLMKRRAKGAYNRELAVKLFMYLIDAGARKYIVEFGTRDQKIDSMFNRNTRLEVARRFRDHFETEAGLGNYDKMTWGVSNNPGLGAAVVGGIAGAVANRVLKNPPIQVPGDLVAACQAILRCKACWAARPYAEAILSGDIMFDDPKSVLLYLRSNLAQWKGTEARIVKQVVDKYIKQGLSGFSNNPRFKRNMPVSSVWDRLTDRQRQWALGFAGVSENQIDYYVPRSWRTLPPKIQSAISAGWRENPARSPWAVCRSMQKKHGWSGAKTERCIRKVKAKENPARKTTMPIAKFAQLVKNQRDPALWRDFVAKCKAYHSWSHGTWPTKVTVERINKPGMKGLFIVFDMGKQPESTYVMPRGSKRKGAWKHPWTRMPSMKGDPQAGLIITKLVKGNKLREFLHG